PRCSLCLCGECFPSSSTTETQRTPRTHRDSEIRTLLDGATEAMPKTDNTANNSDPSFDDRELGLLQLSTVLYYLRETNPDNGLVRDKTEPAAPVSIAAIGMALATVPVVVERGVMYREFAAKGALKRLRFLLACPQSPEPDASGYRGFFYHFLDIETGR